MTGGSCGQFMPHAGLVRLGYSPCLAWELTRDPVLGSKLTPFFRLYTSNQPVTKLRNFMKKFSLFAAACLMAFAGVAQPFRPPAVPLVTFDPYLSIWSDADQLTDRNTQHWTQA